MVTLADLWTAPPPWDAQLVRNEDEPQEVEKEPQEVEDEPQEAEDEPSLPIIIPTGIPRTPERPKAVIGPGGLVQDIGRESKTPEPEDEPCYSNLKSCAAQLAPTGSRCLLSLQDDKSVQCCHVVARSTTHKTRQNLAAWWGLVDFDINTPFNIFLLRADVHSMWDQGDLLFMPEPEVIIQYLAQYIVPIDIGVSLDEPFEVCDGPIHKYCVVAHRDVPDTDKNSAFRREFKTVGYVYSRVPPQFAAYNAGLALSKGAGQADFVMALDAFYKENKVDYNATEILSETLRLFRRWVHGKPLPSPLASTTPVKTERFLLHSTANAHLLAHTVERVFRWQRFHHDRNKVPAFTSFLSEDFAAFRNVEARATNLLILWEERGLALGTSPPPALSPAAGHTA
ncbi:predicted protein [Postia placenta Mad-698-R]|nr:predicted protein [Postia placenta Mad-698-R]